MTEAELDEILTLRWPAVMRRVMADAEAEGFIRGFALSIAKHGKRKAWQPSSKQVRIMRQILDQFGGSGEPDFDPIES